MLYVALAPLAETPDPTPIDLLLTTLSMAAVVWLLLDLIERRRFGAAAHADAGADCGASA